MDDQNPFAAPGNDFAPILNYDPSQGEVWRSGKVLVFTHGARLPQRCIKCNTAEDVPMRTRKLYYYPQWILLFILCNLLVLVIVAMVFRKTATVDLGICRACWRRRLFGILMSWGLVLLAIGLFISLGILPESLSPAAPEKVGVPLLFGAVGCLIAAAIVGLTIGQLLVVRKIDKVQIRLSRIDKGYLAMLPDGP